MYRESGTQDSGVLCIRTVFVLFCLCFVVYSIPFFCSYFVLEGQRGDVSSR